MYRVQFQLAHSLAGKRENFFCYCVCTLLEGGLYNPPTSSLLPFSPGVARPMMGEFLLRMCKGREIKRKTKKVLY
jgi:hypothetical protein